MTKSFNFYPLFINSKKFYFLPIQINFFLPLQIYDLAKFFFKESQPDITTLLHYHPDWKKTLYFNFIWLATSLEYQPVLLSLGRSSLDVLHSLTR